MIIEGLFFNCIISPKKHLLFQIRGLQIKSSIFTFDFYFFNFKFNVCKVNFFFRVMVIYSNPYVKVCLFHIKKFHCYFVHLLNFGPLCVSV